MRCVSLISWLYRCLALFLLSVLVLCTALCMIGAAQVLTNITPDGTLGTAVTRSGNVYDITGGTRPGNGPNLFHSFDRFNVGTGDTARFSGPAGIDHILSRVTGGSQSRIDGQLQVGIAGANLFLLNPAGVLFGPNAKLDVPGSFHVSTADVVRLADGGRLVADGSAASVLSVADPVAFGFLRDNPAGITVQGSILEVPDGENLSIVSGNIEIVGGSLTAPSSQIHLASVASLGDVVVNATRHAPRLQIDSVERLGEIILSQGALINASGGSGGTVVIRGRRVMIDGSHVSAITFGAANGAPIGIDVEVSGDVVLTNAASLSTLTFGEGSAGDIQITADSVEIANGAQLLSQTLGSGQGGSVTIRASESLTVTGNGADGFPSAILAQTQSSGSGGDVLVEAPVATLSDGGLISTTTGAAGQGGSVTIRASESLTVTGNGANGFPSAIAAQALGLDSGGDVLVEAPVVILSDGGVISASTFGSGDGGGVTIRVRETLTVTGSNPVDDSPSGISVSTFGRGKGGNITVSAYQVQLTEDAQIEARSTGTGNAGAITITASDTFRSENSTVTTETTQANGGDIRIAAQGLIQLSNSQITTAVGSGEGAGGNITVDAASIILQDSQIRADAFGGPGGNIQITADALLADPVSLISSSSDLGIDGEVDIQAPIAALSGIVTPLAPDFASASALLSNRCATRLWEGNVSSFAVVGRDSVPAAPDGPLPGQLYRPRSAPRAQAETGQQPKGKPAVHQKALHIDTTRYLHDTPWLTLVVTPVTPGRDCTRP